MAEVYQKSFTVRWGDMDFNAHMRNTAYLDTAADLRLMFFAEHGFPIREFERLRFGPVVRKDELEYRRELRLLEQVTVTLELAGLSPDGSHLRLRNAFYRPEGKLAALVNTQAGWLDADTRRLVAPPAALLEALRRLHRTADFQELPPLLR